MSKELWETQNGQKWLAKAIDPAGNTVDVKGLPDQESHNVVVLNYQSQFAVEPPNLFNAEGNDGTTFETEMYLFQHPYVFGVAASYPTGTGDILANTTGIKVSFGKNAAGNVAGESPKIEFTGINGKIFPRTATLLRNTQVAGSADLKETFDNFAKMAQQHRVIYGAAQLVPTCAVQDNSGTISVSQQPFVCDHGNNTSVAGYKEVSENTEVRTIGNLEAGTLDFVFSNRAEMTLERFGVNIYRPNDYPDADDNIRNPASLLTRFYEGAYIPYKLKNPFHETFTPSHTGVAQLSPAWVIGAAYSVAGAVWQGWSDMTWDVGSNAWVPPKNAGTDERIKALAVRVRLTLMTKTGQKIHLVWVNSAPEDNVNYTLTTLWTSMSVLNGVEKGLKLISTLNSEKPVRYASAENDAKKIYIYRYNELGRPIVPFPSENICAILCKAMSMKGNINILIRMGVEMQVTGESTYSPFNHRSPEYDETALKSYLRVVHRMSDGFYGNAASDMLKESYYNWYMQALYAPNEDVDFANRGSYWRGLISSK